MKQILPVATDSFVYSCSAKEAWGYEQFIPEHILAYQVSGETHIFHQQGIFILKKNRLLLAHRNQLAKSLKIPSTDSAYKAVSIILRQEELKKFVSLNQITGEKRYSGKYNIVLRPDAYLKSYFQSLLPYLELPQENNQKLAATKINEAIELLLHMRPELRELLFDFNEPYKIDLEEFMLKNYQYNTSIENFARLTARSLAGFKRDFAKAFKTPPAKWLKEKRLEQAWYRIHQKSEKPSDIYLELGFENLSHFYTAFRKKYGVTPSESLIIKN